MEEEEGNEEGNDITQNEHERKLEDAYRSFVFPSLPKSDIDSYINREKSYVKTLIEEQLEGSDLTKAMISF